MLLHTQLAVWVLATSHFDIIMTAAHFDSSSLAKEKGINTLKALLYWNKKVHMKLEHV